VSPDIGVLLCLVGVPALGFAMVAGVAALVLYVNAGERSLEREQQRRWGETLRHRGLTPGPDGTWAGAIEGSEVQYRARRVQEPKRVYTSHHWQVSAPSGSLYLGAPGAGQDLRLGDRRFDARFSLKGELADLALLTPRARALLLELPVVWCRDGTLACQLREFDPRALNSLLEVAREMRRMPPDPAGRLRQAVTDPEPEVRLRTLAAAAELDPALGAELAGPLQQDEDRSVRGLAEVLLREDGLEATATSREASLELRLWAVRVLHKAATPQQRLTVGRALLCQSFASLQAGGLELLRPLGSGWEPALIEGIATVDGEILGQILLALREVGSVAAVPALRARQKELSVLQGGLSRAIDHAVLALQERAGGERGGLALAGSPGQQGALSVAVPAGALSRARGIEGPS
jgi:hypothetical protein